MITTTGLFELWDGNRKEASNCLRHIPVQLQRKPSAVVLVF
jgi:hypothetical protein